MPKNNSRRLTLILLSMSLFWGPTTAGAKELPWLKGVDSNYPPSLFLITNAGTAEKKDAPIKAKNLLWQGLLKVATLESKALAGYYRRSISGKEALNVGEHPLLLVQNQPLVQTIANLLASLQSEIEVVNRAKYKQRYYAMAVLKKDAVSKLLRQSAAKYLAESQAPLLGASEIYNLKTRLLSVLLYQVCTLSAQGLKLDWENAKEPLAPSSLAAELDRRLKELVVLRVNIVEDLSHDQQVALAITQAISELGHSLEDQDRTATIAITGKCELVGRYSSPPWQYVRWKLQLSVEDLERGTVLASQEFSGRSGERDQALALSKAYDTMANKAREVIYNTLRQHIYGL